MKADKMLILTNMLAKIMSDMDDLKQMIIDMKMSMKNLNVILHQYFSIPVGITKKQKICLFTG